MLAALTDEQIRNPRDPGSIRQSEARPRLRIKSVFPSSPASARSPASPTSRRSPSLRPRSVLRGDEEPEALLLRVSEQRHLLRRVVNPILDDLVDALKPRTCSDRGIRGTGRDRRHGHRGAWCPAEPLSALSGHGLPSLSADREEDECRPCPYKTAAAKPAESGGTQPRSVVEFVWRDIRPPPWCPARLRPVAQQELMIPQPPPGQGPVDPQVRSPPRPPPYARRCPRRERLAAPAGYPNASGPSGPYAVPNPTMSAGPSPSSPYPPGGSPAGGGWSPAPGLCPCPAARGCRRNNSGRGGRDHMGSPPCYGQPFMPQPGPPPRPGRVRARPCFSCSCRCCCSQ